MTENKELERELNSYSNFNNTFVESFVSNLFSQDIIKSLDADTLHKYFSNPDNYQKEFEDLAQYFYISAAEVRLMFDLIEALPTLSYEINIDDPNKTTTKLSSSINKMLNRVKHKTLTRDLLKQTTSSGTLVGMWLGDKDNLYPYIFDDIEHVYPAYRKNGEWVCVIEMDMFDKYKDYMRNVELQNLSPYITKTDYENYKKNRDDYRFKELPIERTFVLRTGTLKRNQALGTSWITNVLMDIQHKKKLKDVERVVANKIINSLVKITIGKTTNNKDYDPTSSLKIPDNVKRQITAEVKRALQRTASGEAPVISVPEYVDVSFQDIKTDGLNGKFDDINADIQTAVGFSGTVMNGTGANHAGAKMNLTAVYKRIGVLLEQIEQEVYNKMINIHVPNTHKDNIRMSYDKDEPLTTKERLDALMNLNNKGMSLKHTLDLIGGINFEEFVEQTLDETERMKLQEKFKPYQSSSTMSSKDSKSGRPEESNTDNVNTLKNIESGNNTT